MKTVYFNINLLFTGKKTTATLLLTEETDRMLEEQERWVETIDKKIKEYFGDIEWEYIQQTDVRGIAKIVINLTKRNEIF